MKKTITLVLLLVFVLNFISGITVAADPSQDIERAAEAIKDNIVKVLKNLGGIITIAMIAWIGFSMLTGGGTDLSRYKVRVGIMFIGIICLVKAEALGTWIFAIINSQ